MDGAETQGAVRSDFLQTCLLGQNCKLQRKHSTASTRKIKVRKTRKIKVLCWRVQLHNVEEIFNSVEVFSAVLCLQYFR